jgi:hypothetical protein
LGQKWTYILGREPPAEIIVARFLQLGLDIETHQKKSGTVGLSMSYPYHTHPVSGNRGDNHDDGDNEDGGSTAQNYIRQIRPMGS